MSHKETRTPVYSIGDKVVSSITKDKSHPMTVISIYEDRQGFIYFLREKGKPDNYQTVILEEKLSLYEET